MSADEPVPHYNGRTVHLTGIKGTGMAALAEILHHQGATVSGSDVAERFFTDEMLDRIGITPQVGFTPDHIPADTAVLIYSAAYDPDNPERRAADHRGIPQYSYTEMLGALSAAPTAVAISGVHGKTSTAAMLGMMVSATDLPATVVVGSGVAGFGGSATLIRGADFLVAETCEYRRHFLDYHPDIVLITNVEADHLDYYRDADDVTDAFVALGLRLPAAGTVVYCRDDPGASAVAEALRRQRPDLHVVPYGFSATGEGQISNHRLENGIQRFSVALRRRDSAALLETQWELPVPGRHMVSNAAAAAVVLAEMTGGADRPVVDAWVDGLARFTGTRRRSERIAEVNGVLVLDDYAHHPTAIRTTLEGFREFWPGRRIVVDFMSHTYSRSEALLDGFADAFAPADVVFLNDIYASAREAYLGGITGERFAEAVRAHHPDVRYAPDFTSAAKHIAAELRRGDIFVTMGAGDNFRIGTTVVELLRRDGDPL
ncbi:MAG: UDP-N-acetylmuramate--L-alanine ligase [Spirochaeta sp.]|nr:UDP-N-acetylmuramate--L-alanine ligase [Spirochaeta sp.]